MKSLSTLILFLFILNTHAQSSHFKVLESQKYFDSFKSTIVRSVHTNKQNHTVIVRTVKNGLTFEVFDENAKGIKALTKELDKKETFAAELFYDNTVKIFTVYSPSKTERVIFCHIYDTENGSHNKVELFRTTVEKKRALFSNPNKRKTNFSISPNTTKIAIATDNINKNSNAYNIHVFDAQSLELIKSTEFYSQTDNHFISTGMKVDDLGNVYCIGKEFIDGKRETKNDKANYNYILHKITNEHVLKQEIVTGNDMLIWSLDITLNDDVLNLIGYYSEENVDGIKGVYQLTINAKEFSILEQHKTELPIDVFEDLYGNNANSQKDKELRSYNLDHIIKDIKGNTYLVAEEFYVTGSYMNNGMAGGTYVSTQHYDDILILKVNNSGELLWGRSIYKRANSPSYNVFLKDNELHVLLNSGKNLIEKSDGRTKVSKGILESSALYDFVYDENGNLTIEKIQDNTGENSLYIPYKGSYVNGKFVMYNNSDNKKQLMILESN